MAFLRRFLLVFAALAYGAMPFASQAQPMAKLLPEVVGSIEHLHGKMPGAHEAVYGVGFHAGHSDLTGMRCSGHRQGRLGHPGIGCCQCAACLVLPVAFQSVDGTPVVGNAPLPSAVQRLSSRSDLPPVPPPRFL